LHHKTKSWILRGTWLQTPYHLVQNRGLVRPPNIWFIPYLQSSVGEWLLNERLLHKKIDVRINGTRKDLFHNGLHENKTGFVVLDTVPSGVDKSVNVKLGYEQSNWRFPLRYLVPETTTENPPFVPPKSARPIISTPGLRVVVIGADLSGNSSLVGSYGLLIDPGFALMPGQACVYLSSGELSGHGAYFEEKSLCRSLNLP
jgi:hypothetical protein